FKELIFIGLFFLISLALSSQEFSLQTRVWSTDGDEDGSIHSIGNGSMLIYEQGPDITHLFGSPYSSPAFLRMHLQSQSKSLDVKSRREKNTAIWYHTVYANGQKIARITDYILGDKNVFFRDFDVSEEIMIRVVPSGSTLLFPLQGYFKDITDKIEKSVLLSIPKGSIFFENNNITEELSLILLTTGNIKCSEPDDKDFSLTIKPGKGRVMMGSSTSLPGTIEAMEFVLSHPETDWLQQSRDYWLAFSGRRLDFESMIPPGNSLKETLLNTIDGVSIALKTQQSKSGGVMAGHKYNMAYVRDMSGVLRGFLALGYLSEARAILDFWIRKYTLFGNVPTADGMDNDAARLNLQNDEGENPAHLINNCFQYYRYTNDDKFLESALPMMTWAFEVLVKHVANGMVEFSGDETYINGGALRCDLYDGSAEATLLFITGGEKLLNWVSANDLWEKEKIEMYRKVVKEAKEKYRQNFMEDGILYANAPERKKYADLPRFRIGWCAERRTHTMKIPIITWTERQEDGRYVCPACINKTATGERPKILNEKRFILNSVNYVPVYIGSDMFTEKEIEKIIGPGMDLFQSKGIVPSNIDEFRSIGHDYGLFLYTLAQFNHPLKKNALRTMLSALNSVGAWDEYYDNNISTRSCCKTRPWESGTNIDALIEYIYSLN
ncbi:MAG: hypothetical protein PHS40_12480, partial [Mariniphaga sp.]|nr:hypothetical protein [Mariniphaga sp.]